ncbi:hypothetical protein J6590_066280 [Homalodisca vitripennis]|nr:hypothetical protein J6590_066280 [Homalodisca vitripennis]
MLPKGHRQGVNRQGRVPGSPAHKSRSLSAYGELHHNFIIFVEICSGLCCPQINGSPCIRVQCFTRRYRARLAKRNYATLAEVWYPSCSPLDVLLMYQGAMFYSCYRARLVQRNYAILAEVWYPSCSPLDVLPMYQGAMFYSCYRARLVQRNYATLAKVWYPSCSPLDVLPMYQGAMFYSCYRARLVQRNYATFTEVWYPSCSPLDVLPMYQGAMFYSTLPSMPRVANTPRQSLISKLLATRSVSHVSGCNVLQHVTEHVQRSITTPHLPKFGS